MDEFEAIDAILSILGDAAAGAGVIVGPGDDAAVLEVPAGRQLAVSTDTLIAGRHFPDGARGDAAGYRSMAVAASDLAAMGAQPAAATVALAIERPDADWMRSCAAGIAAAARAFGLPVVGGNIARGACSLTVTVHGHVPAHGAILRSGGTPGDDIHVTGTLGGARLALDAGALADCALADIAPASPAARYWMPAPRLEVGIGLRGIAHAAIDISDGLASDLAHLCRASGLAAEADLERLPVFAGQDAATAASAGDDYELAFAAPRARRDAIRALAQRTGVPIARIGRLCAGAPGAVAWRRNGSAIDMPPGYRHF